MSALGGGDRGDRSREKECPHNGGVRFIPDYEGDVRACVRSAWLEHNQGPACAEAERVPDDEQGTKRGGPPADWVA